MYKIRFEEQTPSGIPDKELDSIELTKEDYCNLPELVKDFSHKTKFVRCIFFEQVRNSNTCFPAIKILDREVNDSGDNHCWYFVCIDEIEKLWIAFEYWNFIEDYGPVASHTPMHGDIYRVSEKYLNVVHAFYPQLT